MKFVAEAEQFSLGNFPIDFARPQAYVIRSLPHYLCH